MSVPFILVSLELFVTTQWAPSSVELVLKDTVGTEETALVSSIPFRVESFICLRIRWMIFYIFYYQQSHKEIKTNILLVSLYVSVPTERTKLLLYPYALFPSLSSNVS